MTCRIALNIGSIVCSSVPFQKGNILKAIVVDILNLLNRKCYRTVSFFLSDHVLFSKRAVLYNILVHVSALNNEIWISFVRNADSKLQE